MGNQFERLKFIIKTRLHVAWANFTVEQTFTDGWERQKKAGIAAVTVILLALLGGALLSFNPLVGESTASIPPAVKSTEATKTAEPEETARLDVKEPESIKTETERLEEDMGVTEESFDPGPGYAIAVDKERQLLYVLENGGDRYKTIHAYRVSIGAADGRKEAEGDLKTPEGVYRVTSIKEDEELDTIYGPRAYVLNYPNDHDLADGRTGSGIWLHGTGIGVRTPDTKGCVELTDKNIMRIGQWVKENTTVAIFSKDFPLPVENGTLEKKYLSEQFYYQNLHNRS